MHGARAEIPPPFRDCISPMIRFLVASLGYLLLAGGFVAAVVDGTRSIASSRLLVMPLREALDRMWPNATPAFRAMLMQVHPALWDPVGLMLLAVPLAATLAVFGIVLVMISRRRTPDIGYDTRY